MITQFDNRVGVIGVTSTALADAGTAQIDCTNYKGAYVVVYAEDGSGNITVPGTATFSANFNRTTGYITVTNLTGGAFTGSYIALGIF